jgi:hypothetical protein
MHSMASAIVTFRKRHRTSVVQRKQRLSGGAGARVCAVRRPAESAAERSLVETVGGGMVESAGREYR